MDIQKCAGFAGIIVALIYIAAFVFFGGFWAYPSGGGAAEKMTFLAANQATVTMVYMGIYVVFGVVLSVLVAGLHLRLVPTGSRWLLVGSLFGAIWVGFVIASGMIATIGLRYAIGQIDADVNRAFETWQMVGLITESIGGGNELVGGLWVLIVSLVALRTGVLSAPLNYLGCVVGAAGVATVYPAEILTIVFGLSQIVWFIWIGMALLRAPPLTDRRA